MNNRTLSITFLGPLSIEMEIFIENGITLSNDTHHVQYGAKTHGGPVLKQVQVMRSLGYDPDIIGYVGRDEAGEKIIETMQSERIKANIQKIPGYATNQLISFTDKKCSSYITSYPPNLDIWKYRLQNINKKGIIVVDPNIPSSIQKEIIENFPLANIVLRRPIDNDISVFNTDKKLIILLNESEAFKVFASMNRSFYSPFEVLYCSLLCDHQTLVEDHEKICTLDQEDRTMQVLNFGHKKRDATVLNNHFMAGVIAGIASQQSHLNYFLWGLICSIKNHHYEKINKNEIISATKEYNWETHYVDRFGKIIY